MRIFKTAIVLTCIALTLCTVQSSGRTLTVADAVQLGLRNDETYLVAEQELVRANAKIREAWGGALPKLDFNAMYTRSFEIPVVSIAGESFKFGTKNDYTAGVSLTQPIFLGGKMGGAIKIAGYYRNYARYQLVQTRNDVVYDIKAAFFKAKLARDAVSIYEDARAQAGLNHENVKKLYEQGMAAEFDLIRSEVEVANIEPQLIRARNDAVLAEINLKNKIGIPSDEELELEFRFDPAELDRTVDFDKGLANALSEHPSILQQEYVTKGYDRAIGIAKADSRPQLFASSNFQFQKQRDEFNPAKGDWSKSWSASLILSFPIFDGFTNSGRVRQARVDFEQSKYLQQQIEENVALAVRSAYASWQESVASLKTQEKTIEQAAEGLRIANLRYQSGVGTQLEVLSAQTASTQAKVNYINAVYDFELAVAGFVKAAGYKPEILGDEDE